MSFVRFFVGTPRRLLTTVVVLAVIFGLFFPNVLAAAIHTLVAALAPVVGPLFTLGVMLVIMFFAARMIFRSAFGRRRR